MQYQINNLDDLISVLTKYWTTIDENEYHALIWGFFKIASRKPKTIEEAISLIRANEHLLEVPISDRQLFFDGELS